MRELIHDRNVVALVSCVKSKRGEPSFAADLYVSPLFRGYRRFAEKRTDRWYILSAEFGLLSPTEVIPPYERTLNKMKREERARWASGVQAKLLAELSMPSHVILLAGIRYREHLLPFLLRKGHTVEVPLEGLSLGRQLRFLSEHA